MEVDAQDETSLESLTTQYGNGTGIVNISIRNNLNWSVLNDAYLIDQAYRCLEGSLARLGIKTKSTMPTMGLGAGGPGVDVGTLVSILMSVFSGLISVIRSVQHRYRLIKTKRAALYHPNITVRLRLEQVNDASVAKMSLRYMALITKLLTHDLQSAIPHVRVSYQLLMNVEKAGKICITINSLQQIDDDCSKSLGLKIDKARCSNDGITFIYKGKWRWKVKSLNILKHQLGLTNLDLYS